MTNNNNKQNMTISPIIVALEGAFDWMNGRFYDGKLSRPVITLAEGAKMRAYGWFTTNEVWHDDAGNSACELNIASDYLKRGFEEIVNTLAHEMVHCANNMEGIQDCARAGQRHNKKFMEMAEKHGMKWIKPTEGNEAEETYYKKYGYAKVQLSEEVKEEVYKALEFLKMELKLYRDVAQKQEKKKSVQRVIKYVCPCCGCSCRATKEINIRCMECEEDMIAE